jgi:GT2 family glycosyltransferase
MPDSPTLVTVAVCTLDRPGELALTLDALEREVPAGLELLVVDQSAEEDHDLAGRRSVRVIRDGGRGLSRARNLALQATRSEWIAFVDDDCTVAEGFGAALLAQLERADGADWVSGHVGGGREDADLPLVTTFPVDRPAVRQGRWVLPGSIGFGVMFIVRCATARRLGGWDERLGPGVEPFPAADDMDFNHRLLRAGGKALLTPDVRVVHRQWRTPSELVRLNRGYLRAWAGFAAKQARTGHPLTAAWLWAWGVIDVLDMAKSAAGRRSRVRWRLAGAKLRGLLEGVAAGLGRRW